MCQVEELGTFLRERGVQPNAADEGTPPEVIVEINARLLAAMQSCMQALNLGGLKLQSLIDAVETRCIACLALSSADNCILQRGIPCPSSCNHTGTAKKLAFIWHMRRLTSIVLVLYRKALANHAGQEGQRGSYLAARKLGLTQEQVRRGLQYRAHVLAVLETCSHPLSFRVPVQSAD